jgi:serine/threonine protein kinase
MTGAPDPKATPPDVAVLSCPACGRRFKATGYNPSRSVRCPGCGSDLAQATMTVSPGAPPAAVSPPAQAPTVPPSGFPVPFGKYTLLRELGRGGMGVVYEALDTELQRVVALKTMRARSYDSPREAAEDQERFLREARLCANLPKHPHIVTVYDAGAVADRRYLAMEFISGRPMSAWGQEDGVSLRRQVKLLRDVALAVHHAHEHNVIHRDLKPQNVLVDDQDHPHVTDFGLAKAVSGLHSESLTASGMLVGTPTYMSPEQARGARDIDRRSDVYTLGVMLYEILAGRTPFTGTSPVEILMKIVNDAPTPPSRLDPRPVSPDYDRVIEAIALKAIGKDPAQRYPSAEALAQSLTAWLERKESSRFFLGTQRTPSRWFVDIAVVVVIGLVALLFIPSGKKPDAESPGTVPAGISAAAKPEPTAAKPPAPPLSAAEAERRATEDRARLEAEPTTPLPGGDLSGDRTIAAASRPYALDGVLSAGPGDETSPVTIRIGPGTEIRGNDRSGIDLGRRGRLVIEGTADRPVVFRHLLIGQDLGAQLFARHAVFDQCHFRKIGQFFSVHSSKWALEDCLLYRPRIHKLNTVDYGFRWRRCALVEAALPEILFDRFSDPGPQDHGAFVRKEWTTIEACAFLGGAVPPSVLWCTERCRFVRCRFPKGEPFDSEAALDVTADIRDAQGPRPDDPGTQPAPRRAPVRVANAALPPATARFPEQATCPVPELRHDPAFRELFDR